jgi:hypothetical protein
MNITGPVAKDITREIVKKVFEAFTQNQKNVTVYSLPGESWEFEKFVFTNHYVQNLDRTNLICCECNQNYYDDCFSIRIGADRNDGIEIFEHLPNYITLSSSNQPVARFEHRENNINFEFLNEYIRIKNKEENFFAWFDFCGNPSIERVDQLVLPQTKNVQIFTFATGWRCDLNVEEEIWQAAKNMSNTEAILKYFKDKIVNTGYKILFSIDYVSSRIPMVLIAITNDENLFDKTFYKDEVKIVKYKNPKKVKVDRSPIYAALKNKESEEQIMQKHNVSRGTISSCKAWITMGK